MDYGDPYKAAEIIQTVTHEQLEWLKNKREWLKKKKYKTYNQKRELIMIERELLGNGRL